MPSVYPRLTWAFLLIFFFFSFPAGFCFVYLWLYLCVCVLYEGKSVSKLQIVIETRRMGIMTYKQHLIFNVISKQI